MNVVNVVLIICTNGKIRRSEIAKRLRDLLYRLVLCFNSSDYSGLRVKRVNIPDMVAKQMDISRSGMFQLFDSSKDSSRLLRLAETRTIFLLRFFRLVFNSMRYRVPDAPMCSQV